MIDRAVLEAKLVLLRQQAKEQEGQLNATMGAVQILEQILAETEESNLTPLARREAAHDKAAG